MWNKFKHGWLEFKAAPAGERFLRAYGRSQQQNVGPAVSILIIVVGVVLIVAGFLLGLVPGVPGIVLGVLGLALIATRSRRLATTLDWAEAKARKWFANRREAGAK